MTSLELPRKSTPNPFASRNIRPGAIPFIFSPGQPIGDIGELFQQLTANQSWGQIVGPHGSGKSTLLRQLAFEAAAADYSLMDIRLNNQSRRLPKGFASQLGDSHAPTLVVVDGYEQLNWRGRLWLRAICRYHGVGLVVTAHAGMGFPPLYYTSSNESIARLVVTQLCSCPNDQRFVDDLWHRYNLTARLHSHTGNLRDLLFELYDVYSEAVESAATK